MGTHLSAGRTLAVRPLIAQHRAKVYLTPHRCSARSVLRRLTVMEAWNARYATYISVVLPDEVFEETVIGQPLAAERERAIWCEFEVEKREHKRWTRKSSMQFRTISLLTKPPNLDNSAWPECDEGTITPFRTSRDRGRVYHVAHVPYKFHSGANGAGPSQ